MIGRTLGHYEILAPLGIGGMGEVYRARDATLDRDVAIKVLPADFAADPDRLARFEREAKLLASLNHPNIAAIHAAVNELSAAPSGERAAWRRALPAVAAALTVGVIAWALWPTFPPRRLARRQPLRHGAGQEPGPAHGHPGRLQLA